MNVRNRVGGTRILDEQVIDALVLALVETNPEVRLRQGAEVVAYFGVFACHVDEYVAERQLPDELMLIGFQHVHEAEILGRDFTIEVALQDGVRHLVAEDDKATATGAEKGLHAALYVFMYAFVVLVEDDQHRTNSLKIRHFSCRLLSEKLLQGTV